MFLGATDFVVGVTVSAEIKSVQTGNVKLYLGDCLDILPTLPRMENGMEH